MLDERVLLIFIAVVLHGMILSTAAVVLEEVTLKCYPEAKNLLRAHFRRAMAVSFSAQACAVLNSLF